MSYRRMLIRWHVRDDFKFKSALKHRCHRANARYRSRVYRWYIFNAAKIPRICGVQTSAHITRSIFCNTHRRASSPLVLLLGVRIHV